MKILNIFKKSSEAAASETSVLETSSCSTSMDETSNNTASNEVNPTEPQTGEQIAQVSPDKSNPAEPQNAEQAGEQTGEPSAEESKSTKNIYNLIILDESGSMISIYQPALSGMNETLQTIRMAQEEHPEQKHFVSLIAFNSNHYNQIYDCIEADKALDIKEAQYRPQGCTPLYDAMGRSITELRSRVKDGDVVLVTIITDGYENASREYDLKAIKSLVETLKSHGWVFTYIGANQDVVSVAKGMAIDNHLAFNADAESTKAMFRAESRARKKFFSKCGDVLDVCLNTGYFDEEDNKGGK